MAPRENTYAETHTHTTHMHIHHTHIPHTYSYTTHTYHTDYNIKSRKLLILEGSIFPKRKQSSEILSNLPEGIPVTGAVGN